MHERRRPAVIVLLGALVAVFPAVPVTFLLGPAWNALEARTGVEAIGHSGPAGWCYVAIWSLIATTFVVARLCRAPLTPR